MLFVICRSGADIRQVFCEEAFVFTKQIAWFGIEKG